MSAHVGQGKAYFLPSQSQASPACKPQRQHVREYATSAHVGQGMAYFKPSQIQAYPSQANLQAYASAGLGSRYFSTCGQDKAETKSKYQSHPRAARIPQEKRAAEVEAIHKELVTDLRMAADVASKVVLKAVRRSHPGSVLSLENCRGWITTLRQLGLDEKGIIQGLQGFSRILAYSAGGREEDNIEVLRVLEQAGLRSDQFNIVEWLTAKGFPEPLIRMMIGIHPTLLMYSLEECLGPMLDYITCESGSKETAVQLLTKQPQMFGLRPTSIHAKLLMLKELVGCSPSLMLTMNPRVLTSGMHTCIGPRCMILRELGLSELMYKPTWLVKTDSDFATWPKLLQAYQDIGRKRFPTTKRLEDAIVVCQERWDSELKAKFDKRSLMLQAEWKVSGIAGLPTFANQIWKEEE
eukprot:gene32030-16557_t